MKYAIVESGGKQYRAVEESTILVDSLPAQVGEQLTIESVLLFVDGERISVGNPKVEKAHIKVTVIGHEKGPKLVVFKYRAKSRYRVKTGHRQQYTRIRIDAIEME